MKTIAVWFSCGAASAVAAYYTVKLYGASCQVRIINTPIKEEHEDNRRFLKDIEKWVGVPIELAVSKKYYSSSCNEVWVNERYMSGVNGAKCTVELKKKARQEWEERNKCDAIVLGFTSDEIARHERFIKTERKDVIPVLIDNSINKNECFKILTSENIRLPAMYGLGYSNANCIGCVKATSPTYWNHVRKTHPDEYASRAKLSRELGVRLVRVKGRRIFLDELPEDAKGNRMPSMPDCNIFCEEK